MQNDMMQAYLACAQQSVRQLEETAAQAKQNKAARIAELIGRLPRQLFGSKKQRRSLTDFVKGGASDPQFQPLAGLENQLARLAGQIESAGRYDVPEKTKGVLLVLGTIDFDFLVQRPQHLANGCAARDYAVFYCNAEFSTSHPDRPEITRQGRVNVITLQNVPLAPTIYHAAHAGAYDQLTADMRLTAQKILMWQNTKNLCVLIQHPLWQPVAAMLQAEFGAAVIADYLDDFADFDNADKENVIPMAEEMLKKADVTLATSQYLADKAAALQAKQVVLLRNGTDCAHFARAKSSPRSEGRTPVVGYYGVISSWFDCDKIRALSRSNLKIKIRLVGVADPAVRAELSALPKVEVLDPVPYAQLPDVLREFDVCLIPFDASTDLIKATNPVKFYEYLSAGKKVVATEIPELMPYRNKFVYCENDDAAFTKKVMLCLVGGDTLADGPACEAFAQDNDWRARSGVLANWMEKAFA